MDPSLVAIMVAISVGVATLAGAFAASLIIEATSGAVRRSPGTPLTVAARRLARGEISTEEYDKIRTTLAR